MCVVKNISTRPETFAPRRRARRQSPCQLGRYGQGFVNTRDPRQRDNSTDRLPASRTVTNPGMTLAKPMWGSRRDGGAASIGRPF